MPGEEKAISIRVEDKRTNGPLRLMHKGWNTDEKTIAIK